MEKIRRIKWATPQFVHLEKFIAHKFPAVTLISALVGASYGHQYVYFCILGGKLPRNLKKNYSTIIKKKANKQTKNIQT